jgi:hypothetical protein
MVAKGAQEVMADRTVATGTQQVVEDEVAAATGAKEAMEDETGGATGVKEVMDDKMVAKYSKEINLTHKSRRLFQED